MAAGVRKLLRVSGYDPDGKVSVCQSYCYQVQACPESCISLCPSMCTPFYAPASSPAPSPSQADSVTPSPEVPKLNPMVFVTISLSALAAAFVFFSFLAIRRFCDIWFNRRQRRSRRPQIRDERFDPDQFLGQDPGPVVDHPIWHIRTVGLQPSIINKIAVVTYKKGGETLIEGTDCAVCLSEFQEDETLRVLPKCNHPFHLPCIDTWLRSHTNCPICRAGITENPASGERSVQASDEVEANRDDETETENAEHRIQITNSTESPTGEKSNDNPVGDEAEFRSTSIGSSIAHCDLDRVTGRDEAGAGSSSSPASASCSWER